MNLQLDDDTKDDRRSAADEETSLGIQIREIGRFLEQKINPERKFTARRASGTTLVQT
jgi:hypothetical protein